MHSFQIVGFGWDARRVETFRSWAEARSVWFRDIQQTSSCLKILESGTRGALIVRLGANLEEELSLVATARLCSPQILVIAISEIDHPLAAGLSWDVGADFVLLPPQPFEAAFELLQQIITELRA